jgi:hypothetical protein
LNFRSVSYSDTAVEQLFNQIAYLVLNPWYPDLLEIYTDKKPLSEKLGGKLLSDLEFEHSISTGEAAFSSKLTLLNQTNFLFENDNFADLNRN